MEAAHSDDSICGTSASGGGAALSSRLIKALQGDCAQLHMALDSVRGRFPSLSVCMSRPITMRLSLCACHQRSLASSSGYAFGTRRYAEYEQM